MAAIGEHAHRHIVFADAVDLAGEMVFRTESRFQEAVDDLLVGECLLLGALARGDAGNIRRRRGGTCGGRE